MYVANTSPLKRLVASLIDLCHDSDEDDNSDTTKTWNIKICGRYIHVPFQCFAINIECHYCGLPHISC